MTDRKEPTHTAYGRQRIGRRHSQWLEIGTARLDASGDIHVFLNRTPIGGFDGYTYLARIGAQPPQSDPDRPEQDPDDG